MTRKSQSLSSLFNKPLPSGPKTIPILPWSIGILFGNSLGSRKCLWAVFSPSSLLPDVPMARERPWRESSSVLNDRVASSIDCACLALLLPTSEIGGLSPAILNSVRPKFIMHLATAPMFPSFWGRTKIVTMFFAHSGGGPSALTPMSWNRVERMNNACD